MDLKYMVLFSDGNHEVTGEVIGAVGLHLKTRRLGCPMTYDMVDEGRAVDKIAFRNLLMALSPTANGAMDE